MTLRKASPTRKVLMIVVQIFAGDVEDEVFENNALMESECAKALIGVGLRDNILDVHVIEGA